MYLIVLIIIALVQFWAALYLKKDYETAKGVCFGVMTDMHLLPSNQVKRDSRSFQEYLKQDAKLTEESEAVVKAAITGMIARKVEFVILAGDLTNEGERVSHEKLAGLLKEFHKHGIRVYLTPGNHDINNSLAYSYLGDERKALATVTAEDFEEIYWEYGFKQAYSRDKTTLSYCARIKEGLVILTIDANQYKYNKDRPIADGVIEDSTLKWALKEIRSAIKRGERIIGVMHHGIVEHFKDQGKTFSPFLIRNFEEIGQQLSDAGLEFVFTGHLHAQDVSKSTFNGLNLYDIETAALTSAPFAWRHCCLTNDILDIKTIYIEEIDFDYGSELPFRQWASERVWKGLLELEAYFLKNYNGLTEEQTKLAAPYYARAIMAHFCGNEQPGENDREFYVKHMNDPESPYYEVAKIFSALWTDLPDSDNDLQIKLRPLAGKA